MQRTELLLADLHTGSTVAVMPPSFDLDDGGTYKVSRGQRWLWRSWEDMLEQVDRRKVGPVTTHIDGDAVEGDSKNRSKQLVTRNRSTLLSMATTLLEPLAQLSAALIFYRGTAAHVGKSAELEEELAKDLGGLKHPETGQRAWWASRWRSEGVTLDIAHHPRVGGGSPETKAIRADRLARTAVFQYANRGEEPPDLLVRGHLHEYADSYDHYRTRAIMLPCWTLATEYVHKLEPLSLADIGAVMVHTGSGHYEVEVLRYRPKETPYYSIGKFNGR